jgi:CyaY protein
MDESAFIAAADATLDKIGLALDAALELTDSDLDWSLRDGVLTIECDDASRIIVNRHVPNREIWIAAKSGGFHFRAEQGRWRDARPGGARGRARAAAEGAGAHQRADARAAGAGRFGPPSPRRPLCLQ